MATIATVLLHEAMWITVVCNAADVLQVCTILLTANTYCLLCAGKFAIPTDPAAGTHKHTHANYITVYVQIKQI